MNPIRHATNCILVMSIACADSATEVTSGDEMAIIGYVNITLPKGISLNALPLLVETPLPYALQGSFPNESELVVLRNGLLLTNKYFGSWEGPLTSLLPFEGFQLTTSQSTTVSMFGQVPDMANPAVRQIPEGESWLGFPVPSKNSNLDSLHFPAVEGVTIMTVNGDGSRSFPSTYSDSRWIPAAPKFRIGEAFIIRTPQPLFWSVAYARNKVVSLNPGPARIREMPDKTVVGALETVVLSPVVDGTRPITLKWSHEGTGVISVNAYSIRLPLQGERSHGKFTLRVTDADGNADAASVLVERYDGPPRVQFVREAGSIYLDAYGRSTQVTRLFYSLDLKTWTEWNSGGGGVALPIRFETRNAFGEAQRAFVKLLTE